MNVQNLQSQDSTDHPKEEEISHSLCVRVMKAPRLGLRSRVRVITYM